MPSKSALLLPFRTPAGPAHSVYSAFTCLLSVPCVRNRGGCTQGPTCPVSFWIKEQEHLPKMFGTWGPVLHWGWGDISGSYAGTEAKKVRTVHCQLQDKSSDVPCVLRAASTRFYPGNFFQIRAGGVFPAERYSNSFLFIMATSSWISVIYFPPGCHLLSPLWLFISKSSFLITL